MVIGTIDVAERVLRHRHLAVALVVWFLVSAVIGSVIGSAVVYFGAWWLTRDFMLTLHRRYGWYVFAAILAVYFWSFMVRTFGVLLGTTGMLATVGVTVWGNWPWVSKQWRVLRAWRDWQAACRAVGLYRPASGTHAERPAPRLRAVEQAPTGLKLVVECRQGCTAADIEGAADGLASWFRARQVRVSKDTADSALVTVLVVARDPLTAMAGQAWPNLTAASLSMWEPIPVALDADGQTVTVSLAEKNLLLAGIPGAGKSVAQSMIVATGALDPNTTLFILDGKELDLVPWQAACASFAGASKEDALATLQAAHTWMDDARARLKAQGKTKVAEGDPLALVVVDELAYYLGGTKKERQPFADSLRDLVQRGRAAGVIVVAATQRPGSEVVPTDFRDLMAYRWALRCTTPQASDMSLGAGWAARGFDASTIPEGQQGTGFILTEGGTPLVCRSYYLKNTDVLRLAARAERQTSVTGAAHALPPLDVLALQHRDKAGEGSVGNGEREHERSSSAVGEPGSPLLPTRVVDGPGAGGGGRVASAGGRESVAAVVHRSGGKWGPLIEVELRERPGSNSEIAKRLGCDRATVRYHRERLAA